MCWTFSCVPLFRTRTCRWRKGDINKSRDKLFDVGTQENVKVSEILYKISNRRITNTWLADTVATINLSRAQLQVLDKSAVTVVRSHWNERETLHLRRSIKFGVTPAFLPTTLPHNCSPFFSNSHYVFWNHYCSIALPQLWPPRDRCLVLQACVLPARWGRHNLGCRRAHSASYLTASSSLLAL